MIIQFKSAPELGRLRVVSDEIRTNCRGCALAGNFSVDCVGIECDEKMFHFEQVKPNET